MSRPALSRTTAKRIIGGGVGLLLLAVVLLGLPRLGDLWRHSLVGAAPADAFTPADILPLGGAVDVIWRPDGVLGRELDPGTREALARAWTEAWIRADVASSTGDPADLRTSFSGPALDQVLAVRGAAEPTPLRQVVTGHDLEVVVFSADGSIAEVRAHDLQFLRQVDVAGQTRALQTTETWDAVLRLRDGRWRIDALVRRDVGT